MIRGCLQSSARLFALMPFELRIGFNPFPVRHDQRRGKLAAVADQHHLIHKTRTL